MSRLTEKTLIPFSLVLSIGIAIFWIGGTFQKVEANEQAIAEIKTSKSVFEREVIDRLARIETILNGDKKSHKGE